MIVEPKIVLALPISDEQLLPAFVDSWLAANVSLIAIVGEGCSRLEEIIDWLIIGDGSNERRFIATSSHPGETIDEVVSFATAFRLNADGPTEIVRI